MKKNAQNLLEYTLIFAAVAVIALAFVSKFDLNAIKNYVFNRGADPTDASKLTIEAMTDEPTQTTTSGGHAITGTGTSATASGGFSETTGTVGTISGGQTHTGDSTAATTSGTFRPVETTGAEGAPPPGTNGSTTTTTTSQRPNEQTTGRTIGGATR